MLVVLKSIDKNFSELTIICLLYVSAAQSEVLAGVRFLRVLEVRIGIINRLRLLKSNKIQ